MDITVEIEQSLYVTSKDSTSYFMSFVRLSQEAFHISLSPHEKDEKKLGRCSKIVS